MDPYRRRDLDRSGSLFLGLLYLFLFGVVRVLLRDLRAAAREPGTALGRLVVVGSEVERADRRGDVFALDAVTTLGRDVNNIDRGRRPVRLSTEHAVLSFRGRAWYVEDLGSTNGTFVNGAADRRARRSPSATSSRSAGSASGSSGRAEPMTAASAGAGRPRPRGIRPRFRRREFGLLVLVAVALVVGSVSLGTTRVGSWPADGLAGSSRPTPASCAIYLGRAVRRPPRPGPRRTPDRPGPPAGRRPARRPRPAADGAPAPGPGRLGVRQRARPGHRSSWSGCLIAVTVITVAGDRRPLRRLAAPLQVHLGRGRHRPAAADLRVRQGGQRARLLTIQIGPFSGQPSELLKVILVVFLAGYLSEFRPLLADGRTRGSGRSGCRRCRTCCR